MEKCDCERGPATVAVQIVNLETAEVVDVVELCRECVAEQPDVFFRLGLNEKLLP